MKPVILVIGVGRVHCQKQGLTGGVQKEVASASVGQKLKIMRLTLEVSGEGAEVHMNHRMGNLETLVIGTAKDLSPHQHQLRHLNAVSIDQAAAMDLPFDVIRRHGVKGNRRKVHDLHGASSPSAPSSRELRLLQNRTINGEQE